MVVALVAPAAGIWVSATTRLGRRRRVAAPTATARGNTELHPAACARQGVSWVHPRVSYIGECIWISQAAAAAVQQQQKQQQQQQQQQSSSSSAPAGCPAKKEEWDYSSEVAPVKAPKAKKPLRFRFSMYLLRDRLYLL